jgi:hypothetical protein
LAGRRDPPSTVPEGAVRVTPSALHTPEQVRGLVEAIATRDVDRLRARPRHRRCLALASSSRRFPHAYRLARAGLFKVDHGQALQGGVFAPW